MNRYSVNDSPKRNRVLIYALVFAVLLIVLLFLFKKTVHAGENEARHFHYSAVQIMPGDTLWSIAEQYAPESTNAAVRKYVDDLVQVNGLRRDDLIIAGRSLTVICYEK